MNIEIREYKKEELKKADELLTKLIHDEKQYDSNINENCIIDSYYETCMQENNQMFFAIENEKIIGYIYGFIENNGDTTIKEVAKIDALYIEKEYRYLGIGKKLINAFTLWANSKNIEIIEISVLNTNQSALNLYTGLNFKETKTILKLEI